MAAESDSGSISGRVSDSDGEGLPGAAVTAQGPGGERAQVTEVNGDYRFSFLPPGEYELVFILDGFKTERRKVTLKPNEDSRLDVTLTVDV